jgi:hypothetical protein
MMFRAQADKDHPPTNRPWPRPVPWLAGSAAVSLAVLALAGCGGSSSSTTSGSASPSTTVAEAAVTTSAAQAKAPAAHAAHKARQRARTVHARSASTAHPTVAHSGAAPKISKGNPVHTVAPGTGGNTVNDDHPAQKASKADAGSVPSAAANPCVVTQAQASAFTGKNVAAPKVAPLGPTCLYAVPGRKTEITLAVQMAAFSKLRPHIQNLSKFRIDGRTAYCGVYGTPITYVPLGQGRLLSISAPCGVGRKFAAAALPTLLS